MKLIKKYKLPYICLISLIVLVIVVVGACLIKQSIVNSVVNDDINAISTNADYSVAVSVDGVGVMEQKVSCGYAVIELMSEWAGRTVTEQQMLDDNGKVTTSFDRGFLKEINQRIPQYTAKIQKNLKNSQFIEMAYGSLSKGVPVPFTFASLTSDKTQWTLHYSIITGIDVPSDIVTVSNVYGYEETYTLEDFLKATRFDSYENMPFYLKLAFDFGVFHKNTLFMITSQ